MNKELEVLELDIINEDFEEGIQSESSACKIFSLKEAVWETRRNRGRADLQYMSQLCGLSVPEILKEAGGVYIWQDPLVYALNEEDEEGWLWPEQYFQGKMRKKLRDAIEMNEIYGRFESNIEELKKRQPEEVPMDEIFGEFGATYIPVDIYNTFVKKLLELDLPSYVEVVWKDFAGRLHINKEADKDTVKNKYTYGTSKMSAVRIMQNKLEGKPGKYYDEVELPDSGKKKKILNIEETMLIKEKEQLIEKVFQMMIRSDEEIAERIKEAYYDTYDYVLCRYDGSYLDPPGVNLYKTQKDSLARTLLSDNVLLARRVGSGKNYIMYVSCHEKKRMGLSERNLMVLQNSVLDDAIATHRKLYPEDSLLEIQPKDFTEKNYSEIIRRIKEEDHVAIYMASSSFDMLTVSRKYDLKRKEKEIKRCKRELSSQTLNYEKTRQITKILHKREKEYTDLLSKEYHPVLSCFETLGITTLFVDECHNYKNISHERTADGLAGTSVSGSKKCDELLKKVRSIQEKGGSVVFATGTPIANSIADLYVFQKYLQPKELEFCEIEGIDQWLKTFGEKKTGFEIDVNAQNFRVMTRYSHFHNLPELMAMSSNVFDYYFEADDSEKRPDSVKYIDIMVDKTPQQDAYMKQLVERTERIRTGKVAINEDNMLQVTMDGRKCALDIRLVQPELIGGVDYCKAQVCAEKLVEMYHRYSGKAQIVFCDMSTPKQSFNIYEELRLRLVNLGIPASEIAFIHEGTSAEKRSKLLNNLNDGKIRIMVGSTQKLGMGVNVQKNLIAEHHLDIPWRPSDLTQREGRIDRQGNTNEEVFIFRYITRGSFDSYMWQKLELKQRFISSLLSGALDPSHRDEQDISHVELNYAEVKALALENSRIKDRAEKANQVERLKVSNRRRKKDIGKLEELLNVLPDKIAKKKALIEAVEKDIVYYAKQKKPVAMEVRDSFGTELIEALSNHIMCPEEYFFKMYQGFEVVLPKRMAREKKYVILRRNGGAVYHVKMDGDRPLGCSKRLDYVLEHLPNRKQEHEEKYLAFIKDYQEAKMNLERGNSFEEELAIAEEELERIDQELNVV